LQAEVNDLQQLLDQKIENDENEVFDHRGEEGDQVTMEDN